MAQLPLTPQVEHQIGSTAALVGTQLPDFEITLLDGTVTSLYKMITPAEAEPVDEAGEAAQPAPAKPPQPVPTAIMFYTSW